MMKQKNHTGSIPSARDLVYMKILFTRCWYCVTFCYSVLNCSSGAWWGSVLHSMSWTDPGLISSSWGLVSQGDRLSRSEWRLDPHGGSDLGGFYYQIVLLCSLAAQSCWKLSRDVFTCHKSTHTWKVISNHLLEKILEIEMAVKSFRSIKSFLCPGEFFTVLQRCVLVKNWKDILIICGDLICSCIAVCVGFYI